MFLHLGAERIVYGCDIIGIFDIENTSVSKLTRIFLAKATESGQVENVTVNLPRSFIVCKEVKKPNKSKVYISQISPATLKKRTGL